MPCRKRCIVCFFVANLRAGLSHIQCVKAPPYPPACCRSARLYAGSEILSMFYHSCPTPIRETAPERSQSFIYTTPLLHSPVPRRIKCQNSTQLNLHPGTLLTHPNQWRSPSPHQVPSPNVFHHLCKAGHLERALNVLLHMDHNGIVPPIHMLASFLRACSTRKALRQVMQLHSLLVKHGLDSTKFLGENVVSTLVACGALEDALDFFHTLSHPTVFSWTAIISGYAQSGRAPQALQMYGQMQQQGVPPNAYTFVALLKACGSISDLKLAKQIHADAIRHRCHSDLFVGNCLVNMYGKCGSIVDAQNVFDSLPQRDVVSWNAMLKAYCHQAQASKAIQLYKRMLGQICPDARTFVSAIQACGLLADQEEQVTVDGQTVKENSLKVGKAIHADAQTYGLHMDPFVCNTLVSMYGKCGSIVDAHAVFVGLRHPDIVSWNAMLAALVHRGQAEQALQLFGQMQEAGVSPNNLTCSTLISVHGKCGNLADAHLMFQRLPQPDVVSWNSMLAAYAEQGQGEKGMQLYCQLQEDGVSPNPCTFVTVLQLCRMLADNEDYALVDGRSIRVKSLGLAKAIHADVYRRGYDGDAFVGSNLVHMYGKCSSIVDADNTFNSLTQRDVVAWSTMIMLNVEHGFADKAVKLHEQMQEQGFSPNDRTLVSMLQAYGMLSDKEERLAVDGQSINMKLLERVRAIHAYVQTKAYDSNIFLESTILDLYGRCGSIKDAEIVFDTLPTRDVVAWTAMLSVYVEQGQPETAFRTFQKLHNEGMSPNERTLVSILQACGMVAEKLADGDVDQQAKRLKCLEQGKALHADAHVRGYDTDVFVNNTLISMYWKCGSTTDAQSTFANLSQRNVVSWNVMLAGYGHQGQPIEALKAYDDMRKDGVRPDDKTCNTLVGILGKCSDILRVRVVFNSLLHRDAVVWTAMLAAYLGAGQPDQALQLYGQMWDEGVSPNSYTFVTALQACGLLGEEDDNVRVEGPFANMTPLERGVAVHGDLREKGYGSDLVVASALISMYGKCGSAEEARNVFDGLLVRDVVVWTAMLTAYVDQGHSKQALTLYEQMKEQGISPNDRTFVCAIQACSIEAGMEEDKQDVMDGKIDFIDIGKAIHDHARRKGYDADVFVASALICFYGKCGSIDDAQNVFDGVAARDIVSCNAMLAAYVEHGSGEKAIQLYRQMRQEGVVPNENTLVLVLRSCSSTGSLDVLKEVHQALDSAGGDVTSSLGSTLIIAYGRCASMQDALTVFGAAPKADLVLWNALIASYARQGDAATSLKLFDKMQLQGVPADGATFLSILSSCSHAGLLERGIEYFNSMTRDHGIFPKIEHYVSIVDLLGRAGSFTTATDLISSMPVKPNLAMWLCLMAACRKHGNVALGKKTFDSAVGIEPKHPSPYILMSNIYADAGLSDNAKGIQKLREEAGAWKHPGQSWIGHGEEVHAFVADDCNHPQNQRLRGLLKTLKLEWPESC